MKKWFLKRLFSLTAGGLLLFLHGSFKPKTISDTVVISTHGSQPAVAVDRKGSIHVSFGHKNEIFYAYSTNQGRTFTPAEKIATLPDMHLGMTRGPQIAVTNNFVVVANVTKQGRIMVYRRQKTDKQWHQPVNLLDTDTTALEGFVALAAGSDNIVYAAWLDIRLNKQNNVYSAFSKDGGQTWSKNKLVYASPEGKVCECCRPSIAADLKGTIYVMFRNNLAGNRDMYLAQSIDGGKTFRNAQKLGLGTWPLKACPMEGGGLTIDAQGKPVTIWKRQDAVYLNSPGLAEEQISAGRNCSIAASSKDNFLVWQQNNSLWAKSTNQLAPVLVGTGSYPRAVSSGLSHVVVWEANETIMARQMP